MSNPPASNHRSLTGFVTKLVGDGATYGFINDEIFFPQTNVTGGPAAVGDQVFAECEFSAHLPIKWNATSVKILNKGANNQHQQAGQIINDPRQQHQQEAMNQQQQFNQANPVAVTYQQHRQQRQQRQMLDIKQQEPNSMKQPSQQQNPDLPTRLLDQANNSGGEFFQSPFAQQNQQQQDSNIQPFQDQPMGPPNFTYTSQLGSAFVQSPFVPAPFLPQQPPPMLPQQQQQQQQQQQHLLPNNQQMHNQNNQRHNNQLNKGTGNRFNNNSGNNNQNDKNDRQNNRRNANRNDDKYDRQRGGDREGSQNRSGRSRNSRERSIGRGSKREDPPTRPSPPPHSSNRSTASVSSDRGTKGKKHYEVQNIPKTQILTNMNAYNMKQRCPSSVHVPSDLKDIIINQYFRLDIKNTPKPIKYTIEQPQKSESSSNPINKETKETKVTVEDKNKDQDANSVELDANIKKEPQLSDEPTKEEKTQPKTLEQPTPPSSRSDVKLVHKYGVKVILLSLPDLDAIYKSVFGPNLESFSSDSKSRKRLDDVISLLCNKGSNNGYSLIGGKFDPTLDGFLDGESSGSSGGQPDLIATCKRVIMEQTGLDLSRCKSWNLLSTFMYNHKSDYFSQKASVEYSFIYMPQTWTMLSDSFDKVLIDRETINSQEKDESDGNALECSLKEDKMEVNEAEVPVEHNVGIKPEKELQTEVQAAPIAPTENETVGEELAKAVEDSSTKELTSTLTYESLAELKVTDLKAELDKRGVKYKTGSKKAELIALLQESLRPDQDENPIESQIADTVATEQSEKVDSKDENQPEEGEVLEAEASDDSSIPEADLVVPIEETCGKRKNEDDVEDSSSTKRVCTDSEPAKEERIELIRESFVVRGRDEQQQLSLISLHEAGQAARHDQFELSVSSIILKESLVQHLSEYILTALVEDNRQRVNPSTQSASVSSQETGSDTNNNSTNKTFKNPSSTSDQKVNLKELPVDRYINLAFSYFDSSHVGYVYFDDLNKLFNNTGLTISKRALISLTGDSDKFNYRTLPDLSPKLSPTYLYEFPSQFKNSADSLTSVATSLAGSGRMIDYKGVTYDVESLVQQVRDAETLRVNLVDRFNYAIENCDKQAEEIHVLEVNQKSLAKAIKTQNDEICDLKRERDSIKKKYENVRKGIKGTISSLSDLVKEEK